MLYLSNNDSTLKQYKIRRSLAKTHNEKMKLLKATLLALTNADLYLQMPRGSNNRLNENSQNRANNNRLFDSQNNNKERDSRFHFFSALKFLFYIHFRVLIQCHDSPI